VLGGIPTNTVVICQAIAPDGSDYGRDRGGSDTIKGCGWHVEIQHGSGITTRYCHLKTGRVNARTVRDQRSPRPHPRRRVRSRAVLLRSGLREAP
jgi:hypothetical protein